MIFRRSHRSFWKRFRRVTRLHVLRKNRTRRWPADLAVDDQQWDVQLDHGKC